MRTLFALLMAVVVTVGLAACDPNTKTDFVHLCSPATSLCLHGSTYHLMGGTNYGTMDDPSGEVNLARALKRDAIEAVIFQCDYRNLADAKSACTWDRMDRLLADARTGGVRVILNLSEFAKDDMISHINPLTDLAGWNSYLDFIANRVNTVNGVRYKNDPTIAMVELWGEPCYVGEDWGGGTDCDGAVTKSSTYTVANMATFFHNEMARWHADAPNILVSTGGFSHINDAGDRLAWKQGMGDVNNATCDVEVNSTSDYSIAIPEVTSYCSSVGKAWFLAAWSACYQDSGYSWPYMGTDQAMADHARNMYDTAAHRNGTPSTYPGVGADFWNLKQLSGPSPGHCDIDNTTYPITAQTIRNNP